MKKITKLQLLAAGITGLIVGIIIGYVIHTGTPKNNCISFYDKSGNQILGQSCPDPAPK